MQSKLKTIYFTHRSHIRKMFPHTYHGYYGNLYDVR